MSPSCLEAAIGKRIPLPTIQGPQRCAEHFRASFPARCCHCHGGCLIEHAKSTVRRGPSKTRAALDWNGFVIPQQQPTPCSDESFIGLSLIMASREPVWGPPRIRATTDSFEECQDMPSQSESLVDGDRCTQGCKRCRGRANGSLIGSQPPTSRPGRTSA